MLSNIDFSVKDADVTELFFFLKDVVLFELWIVYHKYLKVVGTNQKYKYLLFFLQLNCKAAEHAVFLNSPSA